MYCFIKQFWIFFWFIGNKVAPPEKLDVNIWDGEVTVTWEDPVNLPSYYWYNVEMGRYV